MAAPASMESIATVATDRPARYGKQLTSHMGHKTKTTWSPDGRGSIEMPGATAVLECLDGALRITIDAPADKLDGFESVVGRHLVMFGKKDELVAEWHRSDGSIGTEQRSA